MKHRAILSTLVCVLVSSCGHTVLVEAPILKPVVAKVPLKVTVAYDEALRNHRCTASKGYIADEWLIKLGRVSMLTFTPLFLSMFEDVVFFPAGAATSIDDDSYVIQLSLEEYTGCDVSWPIFGSSVVIAYSANITRGSEKVLGAWTGYGEAVAQDIEDHEAGASLLVEGDYLGRLTSLAIRRAAADFLWNFEEDERVRAWKSAAIPDARND